MLPSYKHKIFKARFTDPKPKGDLCQRSYLRALAEAISRNPEGFIEAGDIETDGTSWMQVCLPNTQMYPNDVLLGRRLERLRYYRMLEQLLSWVKAQPVHYSWTYDDPRFLVYWSELNAVQFVAENKSIPTKQLNRIVAGFTHTAIHNGKKLGEGKYPKAEDGSVCPNWVVSKQSAWRRALAVMVACDDD